MVIIKMKDIRALSDEDLESKFEEVRKELFHERGIASMGGAPSSPGKVRALRTSIARLLTVKRERELGLNVRASEQKSGGARK